MQSGDSVRLDGEAGYLIVPILVIPAAAATAFTYFRETLPDFCLQNAEKVLAIAGVLTAALCALALFRKSRRVELRNGWLGYRSWFTHVSVPVTTVTALTLETEAASGDQVGVDHYLTVWAADTEVMRLDTALWPKEGLTELARALRRRLPTLRLDRDVEAYIGG
ncbi:MAG TPA: hypothetical protein VEA38_22140 [Terriglobales bacterium]|nr:hypothetical protein [Terriglobales bacterium]